MKGSIIVVGIVCLLGLTLCHASEFLLHHEQVSTQLYNVSESAFLFNPLQQEQEDEDAMPFNYEDVMPFNYETMKLAVEKEGEEEEEDKEDSKDLKLHASRSDILGRRRLVTNYIMKKKKKTKTKAKKVIKKLPYKPKVIKKLPSKPVDYLNSKVKSVNKIDTCWRYDVNWDKNRQKLADCAIGFGYNALGGKGGAIYVVTDSGDDPTNPKQGTLRYGATRTKPLWIIFARDMIITLKTELVVNSYKTIDGRGAKVEIAYGQCFTIRHVSNVIIHGLNIHHCKPGKKGQVIISEGNIDVTNGCDGDSIVVFDSKNVWIDHNSFSNGQDGLVDVIHGSTAITISNNYFTQHDKVMMLGHNDGFTADKIMKVTLVYNHFGPGLVQRMPRCRWGYFHVANNRYTAWKMYAIGGSAKSTIRSEGNYFFASSSANAKQVTKRECNTLSPKSWNWRSINDLFLNGAFFEQSGSGTCPPYYSGRASFTVQSPYLVLALTSNAGPLRCRIGSRC